VSSIREDLLARLLTEADGCYAWSNGPEDRYAEHAHDYEKVLYCVEGSITFTLRDREIPLGPGDRMVLPPGTPHGALVGPHGCTCIEGRGRKMAAR
jgi:mannose-6-phosphate isomerase-like protein (cupin superfamily)